MSKVLEFKDYFDNLKVVRQDFTEKTQDIKDFLNLKYKFCHVFNDSFWISSDRAFKSRHNPIVHPTIMPGRQTYDALRRFLSVHPECFWNGFEVMKEEIDGFFLHSPIWFKDEENLYFTLLGTVNFVPFHIILKTVRYVDCYDYLSNTNMVGDTIRNMPLTSSAIYTFYA